MIDAMDRRAHRGPEPSDQALGMLRPRRAAQAPPAAGVEHAGRRGGWPRTAGCGRTRDSRCLSFRSRAQAPMDVARIGADNHGDRVRARLPLGDRAVGNGAQLNQRALQFVAWSGNDQHLIHGFSLLSDPAWNVRPSEDREIWPIRSSTHDSVQPHVGRQRSGRRVFR